MSKEQLKAGTGCCARRGMHVIECEVCGHELSVTEQEGVMMIPLLQAKLMAQVVSENPGMDVKSIVLRWKEMGLVDYRCMALSF